MPRLISRHWKGLSQTTDHHGDQIENRQVRPTSIEYFKRSSKLLSLHTSRDSAADGLNSKVRSASHAEEVPCQPVVRRWRRFSRSSIGRTRLFRTLGSALGSGPCEREFTSLLLGPRGSGKTVLLTEIEQHAARDGWIVISLDASTAGIEKRIQQAVAQARDTYEGADQASPNQTSDSRWTGIRLGPLSLQRTILTEVWPEWDMRHLLASLAEHAQRAGTSVLMTIDEVHSGDREEMRRLSADIQHITKRSNMPLGFIGAGLSEMKHTLLMDKKMAFFRRCARMDIPDLTVADALEGLRVPVLDAGGSFEADALRQAASDCGPLPYKLQWIGHSAWKIAGAPKRPIDLLAVHEASRIATTTVLEDITKPAWNDLSGSERTFLQAVADSGPDAAHQQVSQRLAPATWQHMANIEERLRGCGYLTETEHGTLSLTDLMSRESVQQLLAAEHRYRAAAEQTPSSSRPAAYTRCAEHMPRANARCVLRSGHHGGHRSGKRRRKTN